MKIYLRNDDETIGPLDKGTVEEKLNTGEFQLENLACLHGDKTWKTLEDILSEADNTNEMFSYVDSANYNNDRFASKVDKTIMVVTSLFTIFFGGFIALIIATLAYLLFNKKQGGWLIFISAYILSSVWIWLIIEKFM